MNAVPRDEYVTRILDAIASGAITLPEVETVCPDAIRLIDSVTRYTTPDSPEVAATLRQLRHAWQAHAIDSAAFIAASRAVRDGR